MVLPAEDFVGQAEPKVTDFEVYKAFHPKIMTLEFQPNTPFIGTLEIWILDNIGTHLTHAGSAVQESCFD